MNNLKSRILLLVSGTVLVLIGAMVVLAPSSFFAGNGVVLSPNPNLLSEIRAPGGLLLLAGLLILWGAFRAGFVQSALALSILVYGSYGCSRLFSMAVDGIPQASLVGAATIELLLAILCLATWVCHRRTADADLNQAVTGQAP
jgi:hypothetical protein